MAVNRIKTVHVANIGEDLRVVATPNKNKQEEFGKIINFEMNSTGAAYLINFNRADFVGAHLYVKRPYGQKKSDKYIRYTVIIGVMFQRENQELFDKLIKLQATMKNACKSLGLDINETGETNIVRIVGDEIQILTTLKVDREGKIASDVYKGITKITELSEFDDTYLSNIVFRPVVKYSYNTKRLFYELIVDRIDLIEKFAVVKQYE